MSMNWANPDGYPSFTIPVLKEALRKYRGHNPSYFRDHVDAAARRRFNASQVRKIYGNMVEKNYEWIRTTTESISADYEYIVDLDKHTVIEVRP